jgi:hypothetical protein
MGEGDESDLPSPRVRKVDSNLVSHNPHAGVGVSEGQFPPTGQDPKQEAKPPDLVVDNTHLLNATQTASNKLEEEARKRKASIGATSGRVVAHKQEHGGEDTPSSPSPAEELPVTDVVPIVHLPPPGPPAPVSETQSRDEKVSEK